LAFYCSTFLHTSRWLLLGTVTAKCALNTSASAGAERDRSASWTAAGDSRIGTKMSADATAEMLQAFADACA
jgi:hypothetical protein